jgi:mannose-6-phosphate isomerase
MAINIKITMKSPLKLSNKIQHYAWGGSKFIPELVGFENITNEPCAELWMGTHHRGDSVVIMNGKEKPLSSIVNANPMEILGAATANKFDNELPYLFKVLDVKAMLSIQVHPTKKAAEKGFKKENEAGIPLTARHRNYKDDNHKPEVMVALTDFWLLHGFQSIEGIETVLRDIPEFAFLQPHFKEKNIRSLYQFIMELSQEEVNNALRPLFERLSQMDNVPKSSADYWAKRGFEEHTHNGNYDKGIFSVYLYNLVFLKRGEAIYQAANIPHAYLEGVNIELMANSDNVLRGGLTVKHVDVKELLKHLLFEPITPNIMQGDIISEFERVYKTVAPDFEVSRVYLEKDKTYQHRNSNSAEIVILVQGTAMVNDVLYKKGDSFFVPANTDYIINSKEITAMYKAYVPF